jgi:hypothetical protein
LYGTLASHIASWNEEVSLTSGFEYTSEICFLTRQGEEEEGGEGKKGKEVGKEKGEKGGEGEEEE